MLSNLCELAGMAGISAGSWVMAGRGVGMIVAGTFALVAGLALDGIKLPSLRKRNSPDEGER